MTAKKTSPGRYIVPPKDGGASLDILKDLSKEELSKLISQQVPGKGVARTSKTSAGLRKG